MSGSKDDSSRRRKRIDDDEDAAGAAAADSSAAAAAADDDSSSKRSKRRKQKGSDIRAHCTARTAAAVGPRALIAFAHTPRPCAVDSICALLARLLSASSLCSDDSDADMSDASGSGASGSDDDAGSGGGSSDDGEAEMGGGGADAEEDDGFGEDFMGDAEDRASLMKLPEVEREQIIFERSEARKIAQERREARIKMQAHDEGKKKGKEGKRKGSKAKDSAAASSKKKKEKRKDKEAKAEAKAAEKAARKAEKKKDKAARAEAEALAEKQKPASRAKRDEKRSANDALADLVARKSQKITSKASSTVSKRLRDAEAAAEEGDEGEGDEDEEAEEGSDEEMDDAAAARRRRKSRGKKSKYDSADEAEEEDEHAAGPAEDEDESMRTRTPLTFLHVKSIQLRRVALEKIIEEPYFAELVTGMFVKVNVGIRDDQTPAYRLCQVAGVQDLRTKYKFGIPPREVKTGLLLKFGKNERVFSCMLISNASVDQNEFDKWQRQMHEDQQTIISAEEAARLRKKATTIRDTYEYSAEVLAKLNEEKRLAGRTLKVANLTAERERIKFELLKARDSGDVDAAHRLQKQSDELDEIDARMQSKSAAGSKSVHGILDINKRNIKENTDKMEAMMRLQREERKAQEAEARRQQELTGQAPAPPKRDAFKRKETRPTMEFIANAEAVADAAKKAAADEKAAKEAAKKAKEAESSLSRMHAARNRLEHFDELETQGVLPLATPGGVAAAHAFSLSASSSVAPSRPSRYLHLPSIPSISDKMLAILQRKHREAEPMYIDPGQTEPASQWTRETAARERASLVVFACQSAHAFSVRALSAATDFSVLGRFVSTGGGAGSVPAGALRFMQRPAGEVLTIEEYFNRRQMGGPAAH